MTIKRIFYITANELTQFSCHKGVVSELARFEATPDGVAEFSARLAQHPGDPSAILVDVIEEEYRMETIPHVRGGDRNHLLERKLAKLFRRTPFNAAQVHGREKKGRRDDQVMCAALTNPDVVELWLAEVRKQKVPLSGIFSISMVTEKLLKKLQVKHENVLVLSLQQDKILRQSFFANSKLKISRLSPLALTDVDTYVANIQNEVERNHRYINRLQLLPFNEPMDVCLFSSGERLALYDDALTDSRLLRHHVIDINEAGQKLGLKTALQEGQCEWLYAYFTSLVTPTINYAAHEELRYFRMLQMRRGMLAASVMLVLSGLLFSAAMEFDTWNIRSQTEEAAVSIAQVEERRAGVLASLPPTKFSPKVMREAVEVNRQLTANKSHPQFMMTLLGKTLARFPTIHLDEIYWTVVKPGAQMQSNEVIMDDEGNVIESVADEGDLMQMVTIKARLEPQIKKYQSAFDKIERFTNDLKQNKNLLKVEVVSLPLDIDPTSTLQGESGLGLDNPTAFFEVKAVMRVNRDET